MKLSRLGITLIALALFAPTGTLAALQNPTGPGDTSGSSLLLPPPTDDGFSQTQIPATYNADTSFPGIDTSSLDQTQGGMYANDQGMQGSPYSGADALGQAGGECAFNSALSGALTAALNYLLESLFESFVEDETTGMMRVPIQTDQSTSNAQKAQRAKEVCAWAPFGYCVLPSLDAIAFCFVNEIIEYIGQATVEWIKSGFQGSPAFIDDPEKFFTNAVDSVAGSILNEISDGLLCEPWRAQIQFRLLNEHVSGSNLPRGCALSQVSDRWESYVENGSFFSWDLQYAYTQNPFNNPQGSYLEAKNAFNARVNASDEGLKLQVGWGDGFLHVKDPETGRITTPGRVLESQINRRLGNTEHRLLVADEFDEIINALVNELVKLALSELLSGGSSSSKDGSLQLRNPGSPTDNRGDTGADGNTGTTAPNPASDLEVSCSISDTTVREGEAVTVTASSTGAVGTTTYAWDRDFSGIGRSVTKTFTQEGTYYARVTASDSDSTDDETDRLTCQGIRVSEDFRVKCEVSDNSIEEGDRVTYTATVTGQDGDIEGYSWTGATGSGNTATKTYNSMGSYAVFVEASDEEGNIMEADCPIVIVQRD